MVTKRRGSTLPRTTPTLSESYPSEALGKKQGPADGEGQPLDNDLSHVPDVGAPQIIRTAPGIEKGWSPDKETPARTRPRFCATSTLFPLLSTLGLGFGLVLEALQPRSEGAV